MEFFIVILIIAFSQYAQAQTPFVLRPLGGEVPHLNNWGAGEERPIPQIASPPEGFLRKAGCAETVPAHFLDLEIETDYWLVSGYAVGDSYTPGRNTADGWAEGLQREVRPGITVACPKELPLGSGVVIDGIGLRICEDRGGAIIGKRLDVAFNNPYAAMTWGKRWVRVAIIK